MRGARPALVMPPPSADAGISRYLAQTEQFVPGAGEGPVYSTIEADSEEICTFPRPFSHYGTSYPGGGSQPGDAAASQVPRGRAEHGRVVGWVGAPLGAGGAVPSPQPPQHPSLAQGPKPSWGKQ